jgi:hypothetical protein
MSADVVITIVFTLEVFLFALVPKATSTSSVP